MMPRPLFRMTMRMVIVVSVALLLLDHAGAPACSGARLARAGVVRISQSAVTIMSIEAAKAIIPGQYSGGMRFLADQARTLTGNVATDLELATCAAPPSCAISAA